MGEDVEVEFAVDMPPSHLEEPRDARLFVLQLRPIGSQRERTVVRDLDAIEDRELLCRTDLALGHGTYADLRDVVYVTAERLDAARGRELVERIRVINEALDAQGRRFLLIGPGRWGSSDPTLGIGIRWADIHRAHVIVETPIGTRRVEPSQGTHFFRNITAARIGYLTVTDEDTSWLDRAWLARTAPVVDGTTEPEGVPAIRHVRLTDPLTALVDGRRGRAVIQLPVSE
jgi:hypothetical protein